MNDKDRLRLDKFRDRSLRRTSSARSSRSLPRLPPSSHHSKSFRFHRHHHAPVKDAESKIPQHHPSIDMFPVDTPATPKRESRRSASLPASPSTQKALLQLSQRIHDDDVFFSFTSSPQRPIRESIATIGYGESYRQTNPSFITFTPKTPLSASLKPEHKTRIKLSLNATDIASNRDSREVLGVLNNSHDGLYENITFGDQVNPPPLPRKSSSFYQTEIENEKFSPPLPLKQRNRSLSNNKQLSQRLSANVSNKQELKKLDGKVIINHVVTVLI